MRHAQAITQEIRKLKWPISYKGESQALSWSAGPNC